MKTNTVRTFRRALFSSFLIFTVSVSADDTIESITVSATPIDIDEAGSSVSIITKADILRKNATSVLELLREVPGFAVNQQGSAGAVSQLRVRGAEANQVLVLIDGIEANDLSQGSEFDFSHLLTQDIERIEIVRGPQSALWGSDAMAGVIHIITRPEVGNPATRFDAQLEGGSFDTSHAAFSVHHNSAISSTRFSVDHIDSGGSNISRTGSEDDGFENTTLSLSGKVELNDSLRTGYTVRYTDRTTEFDDIDFFTTGLPIDADFETESEYLYAGVTLEQDLRDAFSHSLSLSRTDTENSTRTTSPVNDETRGTKDLARYQLNWLGNDHRVSVLAEHESDEYRQRGAVSFFGDPNKNLDTDNNSVAVEYRYDGDRVNVSLSARHDDNSEFDDSDSWRTTINWQLPNDSTTLHASVGESVKNPTFTERFGFFNNFIGNPDLQPEESLSWEVGVKHSFDRVQLGVTYFDADLTDEVNGFVFDFTTGGFTSANVDGESSRQGVELELAYQPSERFSLGATYTYLDATQEDFLGDDITEVRRPEHSGSLSASYEWQRASLHIAISHTGEQEDDYFPPFPPWQQRVELNAFTLVSVSGQFRVNDHVTLTGRLENVLDEDYEQVFGFESPGFGGYLGARFSW